MDWKKLKKLIDLAKEHDVLELSIESEGEKYCVKLPSPESAHAVRNTVIPAEVSPIPTSSPPADEKDKGVSEIKSPFVGTFYRANSPEAGPFVKQGDRVEKGDVLCIIEAMKIMNEIDSDVTGEIVEICVDNETYVEYGQTLFRIKETP